MSKRKVETILRVEVAVIPTPFQGLGESKLSKESGLAVSGTTHHLAPYFPITGSAAEGDRLYPSQVVKIHLEKAPS